MILPVSLSKKVISLVAATLVMELLLVGSLGFLLQKAEEEAAKANHSIRVTEAINVLSRELYTLLSRLNMRAFTPEMIKDGSLDDFRTAVQEQFVVLKEELGKNPVELNVVLKSEEAAGDGFAIFDKLKKDPSVLEDRSTRMSYMNELKHRGRFILSPDFIDLNRREKAVARRSPLLQASIRQKMITVLCLAVVLNVFASLAAAFWLVRSITGRLKIMSDNALRFADGKELLVPLRGQDEIAMLDKAFHEMADSVRAAARKERAVVENARDVICSIDGQGKFLALNRAAESLFGSNRAELVGKNFIGYLMPADVDHAMAAVETAMSGKDPEPFEARIARYGDEPLDTVWSIHWSQSDKSLFCVIHDDSVRKQAERLRQSLISMISHDLKAPLAFINNFLELLEEKLLGELNEKGARMLPTAQGSIMRMSGMISDMLDLEKVKEGKIALSPVDVSVASIFETACGPLSVLASAQNIKLESHGLDDLVFVDPDMIVRVITNLVTNALKFSPAGSTVSVFADKAGDRVRVTVRDQGIGIPEDLVDYVFDRYTQVPGRKKEGAGLGLAICKAFVELHGGSIRAESKADHGTVMIFDLPLSRAIVSAG